MTCIYNQFCSKCDKVTSHTNNECTACKTKEALRKRLEFSSQWEELTIEQKLDYLFVHLILNKVK